MKLNELRDNPGSTKDRIRVGRGIGGEVADDVFLDAGLGWNDVGENPVWTWQLRRE